MLVGNSDANTMSLYITLKEVYMIELSPCPFCDKSLTNYTVEYRGSKAVVLDAFCANCTATFKIDKSIWPHGLDAIDCWNTRVNKEKNND